MLALAQFSEIILLHGSMQAQACGIMTAPDHFRLSMLSEIIITGHVHLEIIERMGDAHTGYIESDHAVTISQDNNRCRGITGSVGSADTTNDDLSS